MPLLLARLLRQPTGSPSSPPSPSPPSSPSPCSLLPPQLLPPALLRRRGTAPYPELLGVGSVLPLYVGGTTASEQAPIATPVLPLDLGSEIPPRIACTACTSAVADSSCFSLAAVAGLSDEGGHAARRIGAPAPLDSVAVTAAVASCSSFSMPSARSSSGIISGADIEAPAEDGQGGKSRVGVTGNIDLNEYT